MLRVFPKDTNLQSVDYPGHDTFQENESGSLSLGVEQGTQWRSQINWLSLWASGTWMRVDYFEEQKRLEESS